MDAGIGAAGLRGASWNKLIGLAAAAAACLVVAVPGALAATLTFELDTEFSQAVAPEGPTPWLTATFDDSFGGANTVRLTLDTGGLVSKESVKDWMFNFDPSLDATLLTFNVVDNGDSVPNNIFTGHDDFQANGDGLYDIWFDFPPAPGNQQALFTKNETVIYDLVYVAPITVAAFDFLSAESGGQGTYFSAAHVQRIGQNDDSGWVGHPIPEPSTFLLLGAGLLGLAAQRRR